MVNKIGMRICRLYCGQDQLQIGKKQQSSFFSMFSTNKDPMGSQFKQKSLQYLLNEVSPKQVLSLQRTLQRKLNITQYCQMQPLKIFILSWNCNNLNPHTIDNSFKEHLLNFNRGKIDIVVFNLQQMVELSTYNVLITIDEEVKNKWKQIVNQTLNEKINNQQQKFDFIAQQNLVAITTWIFIKRRVKVKSYQGKQSTIVKTGFANGLGGNKGAVIIFLKFHSVWISFVNCHLTAGDGKKLQRRQSLQLILYEWIQQKYKEILQQSPIVFLIGDLNFRLQWEQLKIKKILYQVQKKFNRQSLKMGLKVDSQNLAIVNSLKQLWDKDELLNLIKNQDQILSKFKQKPLIFMPTYKFLKKMHINQYDDKRSPAWCDRILYQERIKNTVNQLTYQDIQINLSDHKPVSGIFQIKIKRITNKQEYLKSLQKAQNIYFKQKSVSKKQISINQIINNQTNHINKKVPNLEQIDFFAENINKNSPKKIQQNLLDIHHQVSEPIRSKQKINFSKQENYNNLREENKLMNKNNKNENIKNEFSQFHQIATQLQKKSSKSSNDNKPHSQNLLDLE